MNLHRAKKKYHRDFGAIIFQLANFDVFLFVHGSVSYKISISLFEHRRVTLQI